MRGYMERELEREEDAIMESLAIGEISNREAQRELADLRIRFEVAVEREAERRVYDDYYELRRP